MNARYKEIINTPYPFKSRFPRMKREERASRFAPFAALKGFEESVDEMARYVEDKLELTEERWEEINSILIALRPKMKVSIKYFEYDESKEGGLYKELCATVKRIDKEDALLVLEEELIPLENIYNIDIISEEC